ncbi:hypothetical protein T08_16519 [Trichinella sp. T8]|nr:hypothetical protein T08_16519 [Trichinella sp. T8]
MDVLHHSSPDRLTACLFRCLNCSRKPTLEVASVCDRHVLLTPSMKYLLIHSGVRDEIMRAGSETNIVRQCGTTVVQEDELVASSLALNTRFCSTGCQYCRYSEESSWEVWTNRVEVQRKDDRARDSCVPERKAFELPLETTVVARIFVHFECAVATCSVSGVRESEDVREGDRRRQEFWTPIAAHAVEDTPYPPLIIQSTYFVAGRTNVWSIRT